MLPKLSASKNKMLQPLKSVLQLWFMMHLKVAHLKLQNWQNRLQVFEIRCFAYYGRREDQGFPAHFEPLPCDTTESVWFTFQEIEWEKNLSTKRLSTDGTEFQSKKWFLLEPFSPKGSTQQFYLQNGEAKIRQKSSIREPWPKFMCRWSWISY